MPTMHQLVIDGATGNPLGGANASGTASTQCCSNSGWPNSCTHSGNCDSGNGYPIDANADPSSGVLVWDEIFSCGQSFDLIVSAPGYNNTNVKFTRGESSADDWNTVASKAIQLTPIQNVAQQNQGAAGSASGAGSQAGIGASSAAGSAVSGITASATSPGAIALIIGIVAVVVIILVVTAFVVIK